MSESSGPTAAQDVVARYFRMWNTGDTTGVEEILAPTWIDHSHPGIRTPQAVAQAVRTLRTARPGVSFRIDSLLGDQDQVAAVGAVHTDGAAPPTRLIWLVQVAEGRMTQMHTFHENQLP